MTGSDIATIVYTSGTTGRPKGCTLTHRNIHCDITGALAVLPQLLHPGASTVLFLPLAHAFARLIQVGMVQARATMVHSADLTDLPEQLRRHRPTFILAVPRVLEKMYGQARQKSVGDVAARRAIWEPIIGAAGTAQPIPADVTTSEHHATADDGAQITTHWYGKDGATPGPAVPFFHGGGYIFGHIDLFDGPVARYVSASGVPMLSVGYRRAPEHPFPTPLEDACTALRWLHEHASELDVDPDRIGVMGDSAGGGMAAALTILARERGGPKIARQILLRPMLDDRTTTPDPHIAPYVLWSYDDSRTAWPALLGAAAGGPDVPATAAPARLEDATGLPPAYIEVGQLDVFRDEDTAYATKLSRAGVPVEFHLHPGAPHEFDAIAFDSDVARRAIADRVRVLKSI